MRKPIINRLVISSMLLMALADRQASTQTSGQERAVLGAKEQEAVTSFSEWATMSLGELRNIPAQPQATPNSASHPAFNNESLTEVADVSKTVASFLLAEPLGPGEEIHNYKLFMNKMLKTYGKPTFHPWVASPGSGYDIGRIIYGVWEFDQKFHLYVLGLDANAKGGADSIQILITMGNAWDLTTNLRPKIVSGYKTYSFETPSSNVSYAGTTLAGQPQYNQDFILPGVQTQFQPGTDDKSPLWQTKLADGTFQAAGGFSFTTADFLRKMGLSESPVVILLGHKGENSGVFLTKIGVVLTSERVGGPNTSVLTGVVPNLVPSTSDQDLEFRNGQATAIQSFRWWNSQDIATMNYHLRKDRPLAIWIGYKKDLLKDSQPVGKLYPTTPTPEQTAAMRPFEDADATRDQHLKTEHTTAVDKLSAPHPAELKNMYMYAEKTAELRGLPPVPVGDLFELYQDGLYSNSTQRFVRPRDNANAMTLMRTTSDTRVYEYDPIRKTFVKPQYSRQSFPAGYVCVVLIYGRNFGEGQTFAYSNSPKEQIKTIKFSDTEGTHTLLPAAACASEAIIQAPHQRQEDSIHYIELSPSLEYVSDAIEWFNEHIRDLSLFLLDTEVPCTVKASYPNGKLIGQKEDLKMRRRAGAYL